jgi:hypothetical protein
MYPVTVSEEILPHMIIRIHVSLPIKEHNQRPQECQWTRPPKTTQTLSTRKPSIYSMSNSEFEVDTGGNW